jgi:probable FeS assembly SUF system protein SufT
MEAMPTIQLTRGCDAVEIPTGNRVVLAAGTTVEYSPTDAGSYTLRTPGGQFTVDGKDADALGLDQTGSPSQTEPNAATTLIDEKTVWEVLRTCHDPEIPVNIVDLGLIYDITIEPSAGGRSRVLVKMTLTTPGCGMGTYIAADAREKLLATSGVEEASVDLVWEPPWTPQMISVQGRRALGLD